LLDWFRRGEKEKEKEKDKEKENASREDILEGSDMMSSTLYDVNLNKM